MIRCENCRREFDGHYPIYCACGHVTGREAGYRFESQANAWRVLHERFATAILSGVWNVDAERKWFAEIWTPTIPRGCGCGDSWPKLLSRIGLDWDSAESAFFSSWQLHNAVSREHSGCPELSFAQARFLFLGEAPTRDRCVITIATGHKFREILKLSRRSFFSYALKCNADYYELTDSQFNDWKREKFRVYDFAKRYSRCLFVDSDCWIRASCPDLFEHVTQSIAMHDDYPFLSSHDWLTAERRAILQSQGIDADPAIAHCFNSGIVMCSRETAGIWLPPTKPFPNRHVAEQMLVEYQALQLGQVQSLPRIFNCQFWMRDFADAATDSHIIHLADCRAKLNEMQKLASC